MKIKNSLKALKALVKSKKVQIVTRKDGKGKARKVVIVKDGNKRKKTKQ